MYLVSGLLCLAALPIPAALAAVAGTSDKRGLIYIDPPKNWPKAAADDWKQFLTQPSDISWYYNYKASATKDVTNFSPNTIFVPMLWGMPKSSSDTTFLDTVTSAVKSGQRIDSVLFLNEPDGDHATGGSAVSAEKAAELWKSNMEPLKQLTGYDNIVNGSIKLGGPAVTGSPSGLQWLKAFESACDGGCSVDFLPVHFYGSFEGLASHMGEKQATFPDWAKELWITEYALAFGGLYDTQDFFNTTAEYFDRLNFTMRYSYFGSFRSSVSNVGPNVAMLDGYGKLTDIGAYYLGRPPTGVIPTTVGAGAARTRAVMMKGAAAVMAAAVTCWLAL